MEQLLRRPPKNKVSDCRSDLGLTWYVCPMTYCLKSTRSRLWSQHQIIDCYSSNEGLGLTTFNSDITGLFDPMEIFPEIDRTKGGSVTGIHFRYVDLCEAPKNQPSFDCTWTICSRVCLRQGIRGTFFRSMAVFATVPGLQDMLNCGGHGRSPTMCCSKLTHDQTKSLLLGLKGVGVVNILLR